MLVHHHARILSVHIVVEHIELLHVQFNDKCSATFPLSPHTGGSVVSKRSVATGWELVLWSLGCCMEDPAGREIFGGHSLRVSGSCFWALRGLGVFKLKLCTMVSCASQRFVNDIPAVTIIGKIVGSSAAASLQFDRFFFASGHPCDARDQAVALRTKLTSLRDQLHPCHVRSTATCFWHGVVCSGFPVQLEDRLRSKVWSLGPRVVCQLRGRSCPADVLTDVLRVTITGLHAAESDGTSVCGGLVEKF